MTRDVLSAVGRGTADIPRSQLGELLFGSFDRPRTGNPALKVDGTGSAQAFGAGDLKSALVIAMHPYPHTYVAEASGEKIGPVAVTSPQLPQLETAPPPEFDGPGGVWSPETLLCASLADCFVLTFRALSRAARLDWLRLQCRVEGMLERGERVSAFTRYTTFANLTVPTGTDPSRARELLEQAEHSCLVANSLRGSRIFEAHITVADH